MRPISLITSPGAPLPFGSTHLPDGINFAIFSRHAEKVSLVFYKSGREKPVTTVKFEPSLNKTGDVWHILIHNLNPDLRYGYRMSGPCDPTGSGHWFSPNNILLDPYAKALTGGSNWGKIYKRQGNQSHISSFQRRCCLVEDHFDWQGDKPLNIPLKDTIIYELHVRGFTRDKSAKVAHPGTYQGIISKIPYLKKLGVTAVQLMPVMEFNELENIHLNPLTGERLKNFWGYSSLSFFSPKASYAINGRNGHQVYEFKEMVKALHQAGIEVILDVVFNHTAEGDHSGPIISFRGIDNTIYYLLAPGSHAYLNFTGCGNTVNCNHPLVRHLIMDALRYWVIEMHVDGFRFDLASILGRGAHGEILSNPPMVEKIAEDPILAHTKIIAEAWDAAGMYQVGSFSTSIRWAELNGKFRDNVRAFMCGHDNMVAPLATRIAGSSDLYQKSYRRPFNSINFITSHDGFTLYDLVSYNQKHNKINGENNQDGCNHQISWNSGAEGVTSEPKIEELRFRRIRTFAVILFLSQGVPMMVAGDEFGRSQQGNNNPYCQDNKISWLNWNLTKKNHHLLRFFRLLIELRKNHRIFRRTDFFPDPAHGSCQEIIWQGLYPDQPDWSPAARELAFMLNGSTVNEEHDNDFFVMLNSFNEDRLFTVPAAKKAHQWFTIIDTAAPAPKDIVKENNGSLLNGNSATVAPMAAVVLISKLKAILK